MKYTMVRFALAMLLGAAVSSPASAGWGLFGHGSGGSSGGGSAGYASSGGTPSYGSSGGGAVAYAGYGSSGGGASYGSSGGGSSGGGSSGGYVAAYGSSGGAGSGGSSGQPGILSRLANRIHTAHDRIHSHFAAKAARHGSSGGGSSGGYVAQGSSGGGSSGGYASGGSSGGYYSSYSSYSGGSSGSISYGSSGGGVSYGSTGTSYGSTGSSYGSVGSSYGSAGSYYGASTQSTARASSLVSSSATVSEDTVQLNVAVPADAVVYVNDRKTTSKGETRQFVSRGLESGKTYRFEIRAELNSNGKVVTDTKTVVATAGAQENVRFAFDAPKSNKVDTAVVLNVPENAEVTLAGNSTQVKGTSRTFKTSQLKAGEVWDDYEITVKVGDQVKSQTIRLIAGDKLELSFNFDESKDLVAAR